MKTKPNLLPGTMVKAVSFRGTPEETAIIGFIELCIWEHGRWTYIVGGYPILFEEAKVEKYD